MINRLVYIILLGMMVSLPSALRAQKANQKKNFYSTYYAKASVKDTDGCDCDIEKQIDLARLKKKQGTPPSLPQPNRHAGAGVVIPKYLDPKVPIEDRISDLLPRLTLDEKVIQLSDSWGSKGIPRLKIPAMLKTEGLHGQSYSTGATVFPQPIAMSSTFNPDLIKQVGKATAVEAKAANLRSSWSPVLDVARDARWGRVEETYGEDPFLVGRMGVAWINGFQGENMIAVPKHFAGHGEPLGGRDSHDVGLSDRAMRNNHLPPFRAAIKEAHAGGVMAAYSTWNGIPDNGSYELLQKILREEWGFDGYVVSDCGGPEHILNKQFVVSNMEEAAALSIRAGVDIECGSAYTKALAKAVEHGYLKESELDVNLRRVFRAKFKLGLFEYPGSQEMVWDKLPAYDTPEHRGLAREVAVQGSVLLKNDKKLLPLKKDIKTIAVIGPNANTAQLGDYSPKTSPGQMITVLQGIKNHVSPATKVLYAKGCDVLSADTSQFKQALQAANEADVVVLVVGDRSNREGEEPTTGENKDGATLEIPGVQRQLIRAIVATGKPVVLVLVNGKPFTLSWEAENIPAILETWYPGEEGGNATADLLFGDRNPSGRLTVTFPRHTGQLPLTYDYMPSGRNYIYYDMPFSPLFRFGYGLSYTSFKYTNLTSKNRTDNPGFVTVSADIENTGDRDGDEVAQLYITDMLSSVITPVIQLQGVQRVSLKAHEKKTVTFQLDPYQLSLLNPDMVRVLEAGKFRVHVGASSPEPPAGSTDHKLKIGYKDPVQGVSGEFEVAKEYRANFNTSVKVPLTAKGGENFPVTVTVKNNGNLVDIADVQLYGDAILDTRRFEIEPGETKSYTFNASLYKSGRQNISVVLGKKLISRSILVSKAPAKLALNNVKSFIGDDGVLHYSASASNIGSEPYIKPFNILVNNNIVATENLTLAPGAQHNIIINYPFTESGAFNLKIGNEPLKQTVVPGGVSFALKEPLVYLSFDEQVNGGVKNEINGNILTVKGNPQYVPGKSGKAFGTSDKGTFINAGNIDLYRKPFSLAAWVNVQELDKKQASFFGGQAPMGADVDITGTILSAGINNENLLFSFQNRDVKGGAKPSIGSWVHVAYTYDPSTETGSVYLNGKLDKSIPQKPYAGPLEMIGASPRLNHGKISMDNVLIARSCLPAATIKELASKEVSALQTGDLVTNWIPVDELPTALQTRTDIPDNSDIKITVETADKDGKQTGAETFQLKTGAQIQPLKELKQSVQVRLRVHFTGGKLGVLPKLQTAVLVTKSKKIRWSTIEEWKKSTFSGSLKIGD